MPCDVIGCNDTQTKKLIVKVCDREINVELCDGCAGIIETTDSVIWELV